MVASGLVVFHILRKKKRSHKILWLDMIGWSVKDLLICNYGMNFPTKKFRLHQKSHSKSINWTTRGKSRHIHVALLATDWGSQALPTCWPALLWYSSSASAPGDTMKFILPQDIQVMPPTTCFWNMNRKPKSWYHQWIHQVLSEAIGVIYRWCRWCEPEAC